ncbi:hypothetical protein AcW1_005466 [Taiwanofungus camphoratus]|nr:hypothetical protein AcV7_009225 [Antrodia cinnamomea]KAI0956893.1 hypothetical protein AcW1_005466 [Antrodia cinnamomea]
MDPQREDLSRISVDSLQDWQRIKANYTSAALSALDEELAMSGSAAEKDVLLRHLQQFIDRAFDMTKRNLRINGRNFEDVDEDEQEEEPFDEGFDRHIWSLAEQSLKWDREIAAKRRERPKEVETLMEDLLERRRAFDEETVDDEEPEIMHEDLSATTYDNVEQVSLQIYAISEELKQSVPVQSERSERVRTVASEMKALKL